VTTTPPTPAEKADGAASSSASSPEAPPPAYTPALDPLFRKYGGLAADKAAAVESLLRPSFSAERLAALRGSKAARTGKAAEAAATTAAAPSSSSSTGGILERAWMMKVAREVRRRVEEERGGAVGRGAKGFEAGARASSVADGLEGPPPAYVS
jgi:hypothetical protein